MTNDHFQFLLEQFKLHSGQLNSFLSERFKITTWSVLAIFGYFGWVLTNQDGWGAFPNFVAFLPVIFALFGFVYVIGLHKIIDRHSNFLDHLENEMFSRNADAQTEWKKFKAAGHQGKPLRATLYLVWVALLICTFVFSFYLKQSIPISLCQRLALILVT